MPPPADIVKVAVEWPGANAQLLEIDQVGAGGGGMVGAANFRTPSGPVDRVGGGARALGGMARTLSAEGSELRERSLSPHPSPHPSRSGPWHPSSKKCVMGESWVEGGFMQPA